ncbi:MAG: hypothetical protein K1X57_17005 [Gemmataceae bacterium]|nr:hypothetical protein [Gemmataceae bacterium]
MPQIDTPGKPRWLLSTGPELGGFADHVRSQWTVDVVPAGDVEDRLRVQDYSGLIDAWVGVCDVDRFTTAAMLGVPQVVLPGGLDATGSLAALDRLARDIAQKTSASRGPVALLIPGRSWSAGRSLDPEFLRVFRTSFCNWRAPQVAVVEISAGIDEAECASVAGATLARITESSIRC